MLNKYSQGIFFHYRNRTSVKKIVSSGFVGFFIVLVIASFLTSYEIKYRFTFSSLHNWLTNFTSESFIYVIGMENRYFTTVLPEESRPPSFSAVAFEFATSVKPGDIRSLLGRELPGFAIYDAEICWKNGKLRLKKLRKKNKKM